jgi:hypothetical protein
MTVGVFLTPECMHRLAPEAPVFDLKTTPPRQNGCRPDRPCI